MNVNDEIQVILAKIVCGDEPRGMDIVCNRDITRVTVHARGLTARREFYTDSNPLVTILAMQDAVDELNSKIRNDDEEITNGQR